MTGRLPQARPVALNHSDRTEHAPLVRAGVAAAYAAARPILGRLRRRWERKASNGLRHVGYELRRRHFYEPFPDLDTIDPRLWEAPRELGGVQLDVAGAMRIFEELGPAIREFTKLGFPVDNESYASVDAETLYAMLRRLTPRHVIELGSGASSHVIALACAANRAEGHESSCRTFDPYAGWHAMGNPDGVEVWPIAAERLELAVVDELGANDVLFVDTTHTVRTGGDVVHIILDLLPRLTPGVYVHFHDIFLPYEYPKTWVMDYRRAWAEQYLLQAFLAFNTDFEVVLPVHACIRTYPSRVRELVPSFATSRGFGGGAFWLRRNSGGDYAGRPFMMTRPPHRVRSAEYP